MMKVVIAMDSLKGSLTSIEAGNAVKRGILRVVSDAEADVLPMADGGEGTARALTEGMDGEWITTEVTGPLGGRITCGYGILRDGKTAVMEMAEAAGIVLVPERLRDPMRTTTYGVGEMILDAIGRGCRKFILGIGGSATNDGGIGMLQALGFGLLDAEGKQVPYGGNGLRELAEITNGNVCAELSECEFLIACDVTNPLCGTGGASAVFGPQKGADPEMVRQLDQLLAAFAEKTEELYPDADPEYPGAGAAGGLGFALRTFLGAKLQPGVELVISQTGLREHLAVADIVITGEGRLDGQTVMGKTPIGVARAAKECGKTVIAFSGSAAKDAGVCNGAGIDAFFPILREVQSLDEAMKTENASANLEAAAEQVFRLIGAMKKC